MSHRTILCWALSFAAIALAPLSRGAEVTTYVPHDAYGFILVNNLSDVSGKFEKLLGKFDAPLPSLLTFLQQETGLDRGVDIEGDVLVAFLPGEEEFGEPVPIAVVPVTDYKTLAEAVDADVSGRISSIELGGTKLVIAKRGKHALLTPSSNESKLEAILKEEVGEPKSLSSYTSWMAERDVVAAILPSGAALLVTAGKAELAKAQDQMQELFGDSDTGLQMQMAFSFYQQALDAMGTEVDAVALGLKIDEAGNVRFGERVALKPGGTISQLTTANLTTAAAENLIGLPAKPFMAAGAGPWATEWTEVIVKAWLDLARANPQLLQLYGVTEMTDEDIKKFETMAANSLKSVESMAMCFGLAEENAPLMTGMVFVMGVTDSQAFMQDYRESVDAWKEFISKGNGIAQFKYEISKEEIAGKPGIKIMMDLSAMMNAPGAEPMFELMYGEGGKMTSFLAVVDKRRVITAIGSKESVEKAVAALRKGAKGLAADPLVMKTKALLPHDAPWVAYVRPKGWVDFARRMIESMMGDFGGAPNIPEFPETPPVGISLTLTKGGVEADVVFPVEMIDGVSDYSRRARALSAGPPIEAD